MDTKKIKEMIELAKESGLSELSLEKKDEKICIKFPYGGSVQVAPVATSMTPATVVDQGNAGVASPKKSDGLLDVTSPFVGTFYKASNPESEPYVKIGDHVSSGKVLCIVEAMKIMNEIESEVSGEVVEICVENETYVEFGQVLFRIKPN